MDFVTACKQKGWFKLIILALCVGGLVACSKNGDDDGVPVGSGQTEDTESVEDRVEKAADKIEKGAEKVEQEVEEEVENAAESTTTEKLKEQARKARDAARKVTEEVSKTVNVAKEEVAEEIKDKKELEETGAGAIPIPQPLTRLGYFADDDVEQIIRDELYEVARMQIVNQLEELKLFPANELQRIYVAVYMTNSQETPDVLMKSEVWDQRSRQHLDEFMQAGEAIPEFINGVEPLTAVSGVATVVQGSARIELIYERQGLFNDEEVKLSNISFVMRNSQNILKAMGSDATYPATFQSLLIEFDGQEAILEKDGMIKDTPLPAIEINWDDIYVKRAAFYADQLQPIGEQLTEEQVELAALYQPGELDSAIHVGATVTLRELSKNTGQERLKSVRNELDRLHESYYAEEKYLKEVHEQRSNPSDPTR